MYIHGLLKEQSGIKKLQTHARFWLGAWKTFSMSKRWTASMWRLHIRHEQKVYSQQKNGKCNHIPDSVNSRKTLTLNYFARITRNILNDCDDSLPVSWIFSTPDTASAWHECTVMHWSLITCYNLISALLFPVKRTWVIDGHKTVIFNIMPRADCAAVAPDLAVLSREETLTVCN